MIFTASTLKEIENTKKTYLFHSNKMAVKGDFILMQTEVSGCFCFRIIHYSGSDQYGFKYVVLPTFNTNYKI